jgi:hypothetical protein
MSVPGITDSVSERVVDSWFYTEITSVLRPHHNILTQNLHAHPYVYGEPKAFFIVRRTYCCRYMFPKVSYAVNMLSDAAYDTFYTLPTYCRKVLGIPETPISI